MRRSIDGAMTGDYRRLYRDVAIQIEKGEMKLEDVSGACYEGSVYFEYATMILVCFLHLLK